MPIDVCGDFYIGEGKRLNLFHIRCGSRLIRVRHDTTLARIQPCVVLKGSLPASDLDAIVIEVRPGFARPRDLPTEFDKLLQLLREIDV